MSAILIGVLRDPTAARGLAPGDWDLLLRQAASADMLATLAHWLSEAGLLEQIPAAPRAHLDWACAAGASHARGARHEVERIGAALHGLDPPLPLILLKGAAYALAGLDAGRGRLFSDIDILVPKERLHEVEAALMLHGWAGGHHDAYDQRYYREWMHELPPMTHLRRGNTIDVHHAILLETARPDPAKLRAAALPVPGHPGLCMLAPHDMVLHSAVHLFSNGEFEHGLRDLFDLQRLLGAAPGFWDGLAPRAAELELTRPLFYALRYLERVLGSALPPAVLAAADAGRPNPALLQLMDGLFLRALAPPMSVSGMGSAALFALYVRGNWLRMPPLMLLRHLSHKAFLPPKAPSTTGAAPPDPV